MRRYLPFVVPGGLGFLGSFGGITRLKGFLPDRDALLSFASQVSGALRGGALRGVLVGAQGERGCARRLA